MGTRRLPVPKSDVIAGDPQQSALARGRDPPGRFGSLEPTAAPFTHQEGGVMDIGEEVRIIRVDPIEQPVPTKEPLRQPERKAIPSKEPAVPQRDPVKEEVVATKPRPGQPARSNDPVGDAQD